MNGSKISKIIIGAAISSAIIMPAKHAYAATVANNVGSINNASGKGKVINVSTSLRVRSEASINSNIIAYLKEGQAVNIIKKCGSWYNIELDGQKGYVYKDYIEFIQNSNNINNNTSNVESKSKRGEVTNVSSNLRMRVGPSTSTNVITYLNDGQALTITGESGSWYEVEVDGKQGYVSKDYVKLLDSTSQNQKPQKEESNDTKSSEKTIKKLGTTQNVSVNLRVRKNPSTNSASTVLAYIYPNDTFEILAEVGEWYSVKYKDTTGYVYKEYAKIIQDSDNTNAGNKTEDSNKSQSSVYNKVLSLMKQQIGSPYVYGGAGEPLTMSLINRLKNMFRDYAAEGKYDRAAQEVNKGYKAFDCSGLMYWAFQQVGIGLGRTTYDQIEDGIEVNRNDLKPGDLLFYKSLAHVGMYIGNGQWIESPNHNACVRICNVPWSSIGRARRVIK